MIALSAWRGFGVLAAVMAVALPAYAQNVVQPAQYPLKAVPIQTDNLLLQPGPPGTPLAHTTVGGVLSSLTLAQIEAVIGSSPLTLSGLLTTNGGISETQTGAGIALPTMLSLARTEATTPSTQSALIAGITNNLNFADGGIAGMTSLQITSNVNGDGSANGPKSNVYPIIAQLNENALASTQSTFGLSQDAVVQSNVFKVAPIDGVPAGRKMRDAFNWWSQYGSANLPTSQGGADIVYEHDFNINGLDDANIRVVQELPIGLAKPLASGGYPASINVAQYVSSADPTGNVWAHDWYDTGGPFSHAAIDLFFANSAAATVTSSTPGGSVYSVTVDNIMPLEGGGASGVGSDFPVTSTAGITKTTSASSAGSTVLNVTDANYLVAGMFAFDITSPTGIPSNTKVSLVNGTALTLSANATVGNGDTILFSRGVKQVRINGNAYTLVGVALSGTGTHAGIAYFVTPLTAADATNGVLIYPNAHAIWLNTGSATAPWNDISLNAAGSDTLRDDGGGGAVFTGTKLTVPALTSTGSVILAQKTVATLPTCNAGSKGSLMGVTDATAPSYNATLTGGGTGAIPVYCNGTSWTAH